MKKAIEVRPEFIYHHLDLARIYIDIDEWSAARTQLQAIPPLPLIDVMDPEYKVEAAALLQSIANKH
jgi:FimV-like protein